VVLELYKLRDAACSMDGLAVGGTLHHQMRERARGVLDTGLLVGGDGPDEKWDGAGLPDGVAMRTSGG